MIGTRIGPLEVKQKLGEGGMGMVFLAEHVVLKSPRVVKVLLPELTRSQMVVQRFINEARAAAAIHHRNIITVHDVGQMPGNGNWYIVMDYLEGGTLRRFMHSNGGPLATHVALQILVQIANGLGAAHARGIIHRDLKPDNILLTVRDTNERHVVILDFGVAKLSEQMSGPMTHTGQSIGTPAYMPPEQLRGAKIDQTCDVYALGVIAYQLITGGYLPFQDEGAPEAFYDLPSAEIYHRQMTRVPIDPRARFATLPQGWATAILAALDRDSGRRPQSATAFVLLLAEATPTDGYGPDGIEVVRTYAPELLDIGNMLETVRSPKPAIGGTPSQPTVVSRYQLGKLLGMGGMAEVFTGSVVGAEGFSRQVAIKRVLPGYSEVPTFAAMFIEEARLASQLAHPNIVAILDFDRDREGRLFLVMEYVEGKDLSGVLDSGPLSPSTAIFIITEVLRGLGYAHDLPNPSGALHGLIHRDVSPHNVLVSWEGAVKVSDFGIAKALEGSGGALSVHVKGKPAYMSPEQANGEMIDRRSDLFAVGIMLHEMLTGQQLFQGTTKESLGKVFFMDIPPPSTMRADVPPDLEAVTMKLLERDRDKRYASANDAIEDLARCMDNPRDGRGDVVRLLAGRFPLEVRARSKKPAVARVAAQIAALPSTLGSAASQSLHPDAQTRSRWPWLVGGIGLAAVAVVVVALGMRGGDERSARAVQQDAAPTLVATGSPPDAQQPPTIGSPPDAQPLGLDANLVDAAEQPVPDARPGSAPVPKDARPHHASGTVTKGTGELVILVKPWAEIWLDSKAVGQTPYRSKVTAGRHRLRLANEDVGKDESTWITVPPNETTTIERTW